MMNHRGLFQITLAFFVSAFAVALSPETGRANETQDLRKQVQSLQQRVDELQKTLANQSGQPGLQPAVVNTNDQWDPFKQLGLIQRQMNQMMRNNMVDFNPREDFKQTTDAYIINMDIPGMEKDKINLEVKNKMLIVSGDRESEIKENKPNQYYSQERSFGHFLRTMALPDDAKTDSIEAEYKNGVLTVKIHRIKKSNPDSGAKKIKIS
jgi:HSP20 family protein